MTTDTTTTTDAGGSQVDRRVRPRLVEHGSDEHLSLLGAPQHLNMLTGQDRADMLAFGRACMAAERERCANEVPSNWCDPLLTGPQSVVPATVDCRVIERLLQGVRARILGA